MPLINYIPEDYEKGLIALSRMKEEDFNKIVTGLEKVSLISGMKNLAAKVANSENIHHLGLETLFLSAGALLYAIDDESEIKMVVSDAIELLQVKTENFDFSTFEKRILFLLKNKAIYYAYKGKNLQTENANNFISCRVLTDIRPVFDWDIEQTPSAGVITHTLHIHYDSELNSIHKDIFICLDSYDLSALKDALERAEQKETSLSQLFEKSGMKNLNE